MTPQEFKALLDGPAPSAPANPAGQDPFAYVKPPQSPQATPAPQSNASQLVDPSSGLTGEQLFGPGPSPQANPQQPAPEAAPPAASSPQAFNPEAFIPQPEPHGPMNPIAADIETGISELPRAALKGAREAGQEIIQSAVDAGNWVGSQQDKLVGLFGGAPGKDVTAPQLPEVDAPKSTTGKLAASVSQFIVGMVGLGKITKPLEVAGGLATAGKAAKAGVEAAKAATVGAVAFDPSGERLSNIIESIPAISNPVSQFLQAQPGDSRAIGRVKNALESIGMDAVLVGGLTAGVKAYRAIAEWKAGRGSAEEVQKALAEAQRADAAGVKLPEETAPNAAPQAEAPSGSVPEAQPGANPAADPAGGPGAGPVDGASPVPPQAEPAAAAQGEVALKAAEPEVLSAQRVDSIPADAPPAPKLTTITDEQVAGIVASTKSDMDAFVSAGGWNEAVSEGHVFGRGERVPWQKLLGKADVSAGGESPELPLAAFMRRVADGIEGEINKARGGNAEGVLTDELVTAKTREHLALWGDNPVEFLGQLSSAGEHARSAIAQYDAALVVGHRAVQDAYASAQRILAGDLSAWGGNSEVAANSLREMLQVVATINGNAEALKASFGRGLRRAQFALDPADVANLMKLDGNELAKALAETGGNPQVLKRLATPAMWQRLQDPAQWLLVNNLLWGWKTHTANALSNAYMGMARPMERIIGSYRLQGDDAVRVRAEAWKQYVYMKASLTDGLQSAIQAWRAGDSVLAPHSVESTVHQGLNPARMEFKTPGNVPDILHNIGVAAMKGLGAPTRAMSTMDELFKQVTYRSSVMAEAHMQGAAAGLDEATLTAHVRQALLDAFDDAGRGVNERALQEAKIATFSQELAPRSVGAVGQYVAANIPIVRLVVPFIKTPFNVLRYGIKMTPGLNRFQAEYREMLSGRMGPEARAQAIGQASMGSLFLGVAALAAYSGEITGGGPRDPKLRQAAVQSGWQPYSFVSVGPDGQKRYRGYGKLDPIAMPLGIAADLMDALSQADHDVSVAENVETIGTALLFGFMKMMGEKTYLKSVSDLVSAITEPDSRFDREASGLAVNFVPAASLLRGVKEQFTDPHMRDARTLMDRLMAITPGLSDQVAPKRDMWGDPITVSKGLWVTNEKDLVDAEVRRMATESDFVMAPPSYNMGEVDLRDITMANGRNAFDQYQEWAAHPSKNGRSIKETAARIMQTEAYRRAPDGSVGTRGTRQWMVAGLMHKYREMAARRMRTDANVRAALSERHREVQRAYAAKNAPQTPEQQGKGTISNIGRAFGVNLDGLMK